MQRQILISVIIFVAYVLNLPRNMQNPIIAHKWLVNRARFWRMTVARYISLSLILRYHCLDPTNCDILSVHCISCKMSAILFRCHCVSLVSLQVPSGVWYKWEDPAQFSGGSIPGGQGPRCTGSSIDGSSGGDNLVAADNNIDFRGLLKTDQQYWDIIPGLILGLCPSNGRRRYKVTPSLIGWALT